MNLESKLNSIRNCTIAAMILFIIGIVLFFVGPVAFIQSLGTTSFFLLWAPVFLFLAAGICELVAAIKILATNWQNPNVESSKVLWGLLAIFLLPIIAPLVFVSQARPFIRNNNNQQTATPAAPTGPAPDTSKSADNW